MIIYSGHNHSYMAPLILAKLAFKEESIDIS